MTERNIPDPTKREVRQRCGFGCVICGLPIYHYDHIDEFANVREHDPANITLLCPNHHDEKTRRRLPVAVVLAADADPHNLKSGVSTPHQLHFGSDTATLDIGSNIARTNGRHDLIGVMVDHIPLIGFRYQDGKYLLQANLFDENNELILKILDNELIYSTGLWDIEYVGPTLTFRSGSGGVILEIQFIPERGKIMVRRGRMLCRGAGILIKPTEVSIVRGFHGKQTTSGSLVQGATVVIQIGDNPLQHLITAIHYGVPYCPGEPPLMATQLISQK